MCALSPTAFPLPRPPCFDPRCRAPHARPFCLLSAACRDGPGRLSDNTPYETDPRTNDTDGDGLTDPLEAAYGTVPWDPDTDTDGLPDGMEVHGWRVIVHRGGTYNLLANYSTWSDPTKVDTDLDGLNDTQEFMNLSDPRSGDTDGDSLGDLAEASTPGAPAEYEAEPPHIQDVQMAIHATSDFLWGIFDSTATVQVAFDAWDNVGLDTAIVTILGTEGFQFNTTRFPHDPNLHHVLASFTITAADKWATGVNVNVTLTDVNGNKLWGDWHQQSLAEQAWNYIVAVFSKALEVIASAVSAIGAFVQQQLEAAYKAIIDGFSLFAQWLLGDTFQAIADMVQSGDVLGHLPDVVESLLVAFAKMVFLFYAMEAIEAAVTIIMAILSAGTSEAIKLAVIDVAKAELVETLVKTVITGVGVTLFDAFLHAQAKDYVVEWIGGFIGASALALEVIRGAFELFTDRTGGSGKEDAASWAVIGIALAAGGYAGAQDALAPLGVDLKGWPLLIINLLGVLLGAKGVWKSRHTDAVEGAGNIGKSLLASISDTIISYLPEACLGFSAMEVGVNYHEGNYVPVAG